jgi:hypothetical protein
MPQCAWISEDIKLSDNQSQRTKTTSMRYGERLNSETESRKAGDRGWGRVIV